MIDVYMLLIEYSDGKKWIAVDRQNKLVIATEKNAHLLARMGQNLMDDAELHIVGYQILKTAEPPVRKSNYVQL